MTDDDFRAIIAAVDQRLRDVGAGELANPELYLRRDEESGEWRRLSPQGQLLDMLNAFDRWLAIRDGATGAKAVERINQELKEGRVEDVVVRPSGEFEDGAPISLGQAPVLSQIRKSLRALIVQIAEDRRSGGEGKLDA